MNIMWITPECPFPPNTGGRVGIWKRIFYLSQNHNIYLYSIIDNKEEQHFKQVMLNYCKTVKFYRRLSKKSALLKCFKYPYPAASRWNNDMQYEMEHDFENISPDFVIVDFPQMMGGLPENILVSNRIILNQHNIEYLALSSLADGIKNPIKKTVYRIVSQQMYRYEKNIYESCKVRLFSFVSINDKRYFEEEYHLSNTLLVPVGAEIKEKDEIIQSNYNIIFVAKMSYPANEEGALWLIDDVLPLIQKSIPYVKLYLVGKDPGENLIQKGKENEHIIVTGTVDSVDEYYEKSNIAAVPIMTGGGVNVKLLEALGHNKFIVTTSKGIAGTELRHQEHVLVADDAEKFAKYCVDLMLFPSEYVKMRNNAYEIMKKQYSWLGIVKKYEDKLKELQNEY